jgi:hypothetical protein
LNNGLCNVLTLDVVCARIDRFVKLIGAIQPNIGWASTVADSEFLAAFRDLDNFTRWRRAAFPLLPGMVTLRGIQNGPGLYRN